MDIHLYKIIVSLGLCLSILTASQPGDAVVIEGANAFYNFETAKAIVLLDSARLEYPDNPLAHFTWVAAQMLHSEANYSTENTYRILNQSLDTVIPILKTLAKKFPEDPVYRLYLGCAIGLRARVSLGRKQWLSTLFNAYKGLRLIQDVAENNSELVDAQLPIGIVEYYASLSPSLIQWGVRLMGMKTNREAAIDKIEKAATQGEFSSIEAKHIFVFLSLWVEDDPQSALKYSRELRENFPQNYLFSILFLECLIKTGNDEQAETLISTLKAEFNFLTPIQQSWYFSYYRYELALFQFLHGDYDKALLNVEEAINHYHAELDIVLSNAWLLKGMIHDKRGNGHEAKQAYTVCMRLDNHSAAVKRARQYLQSPFID